MKIPQVYERVKEQVKGSVAFIGISLGKPLFYNKEVMEGYVDFLHENFAKAYLLIADTPKRHNIIALEGISEEEALQRITTTSEETKIFFEKLASKYSDVHIINWNDASDDNYKHNLNVLTRKYHESPEFREECDERVREFLSIPSNKQKLDEIGSTLEKGVGVASKYHLEELAMLLSFPVSLGERVCEIYPGRNEIQEKLQREEYDFSSELRKNPNRLFMEVYHE